MLAYRQAVLRLEESYGTPEFKQAQIEAAEARLEYLRLWELIGD
jgi:hypothetical protein